MIVESNGGQRFKAFLTDRHIIETLPQKELH